MESVEYVLFKEKNIEIPQSMLERIGSCLKSTNMNNVMLLITSSCDERFPGEPLSSNGSAYFFPEEQLSALNIKSGDEARLVFSEELGFIIMQKRGAEI